MFNKNKSLKSISIIIKENPRAVSAVCAALIFASLLEAIGVSAIFPLISIILDTNTPLPESKLTDFIEQLSGYGPYFLSAFIVGMFILKSLILYLAVRIVAYNVANFSHDLRTSFVDAMLNARIHFILSKSLGENLSVLTNDSIRAAAAYTSLTRFFACFLQVIMYFCYALWLSLEATAVSVITMLFLVVVIKGTLNRTRRAGARTTQYIHDISRNMGEALRGMKEAKATAREEYLASYIIKGSEELRNAHKTNIIVGQTLRNIQDPVTVASALVCLLMFKDFLGLEPGYIVFILAVYYRMMTSLNTMVGEYQKFLGQETAVFSIQGLTANAVAEREESKTGGETPDKTSQDIQFKNVTKHYDDKEVFSDVSFVIKPKTLCVFKGESGKGKTTAIDLICRLIDPTEGDVLIGRTSLKDIDTKLWRNNIGYVDQFPFLFRGAIKNNVLMGMDNVSDEKLNEAIRSCHLEKFVEDLPEGLGFELNEGGTNISGGQRQRIAIARSIVREPSYLILDEPTSALDQESAEAVMRTLSELSKNITVIMISHSQLAEDYADQIIDFDKF